MTSLVKVRAALKTLGTDNATLFASHIDSSNLAPYKWGGKETTKHKLGLTGPDGDWFAILGKKQVPAGLARAFTAKDLQEICLRDLPEAREYFGNRLKYFIRADSAQDAEENSEDETGMQVINGLTSTSDDANSTIVSFPSETLEDLCSPQSMAYENTLRTTMTTCTLLPTDTLLPIYHNAEAITTTTLLSGSIAWIIWPPSEANLLCLRNAYELYAAHVDDKFLHIAQDLEGGQIFVQGVGEGLRVPPFAIMSGLALDRAVLATHASVSAEGFISMLGKLPLLKAWFEIAADGERAQKEFGAAVLRYLDWMLNGCNEFPHIKLPRTKNGLLDALLGVWDGIKDQFAGMLGPVDCEVMVKIWVEFLVSVVGRECRVCGAVVKSKAKMMKRHFVEGHWVGGREKWKKKGASKGKETADEGNVVGEVGEDGEVQVIEGEDEMELDGIEGDGDGGDAGDGDEGESEDEMEVDVVE